MTTESNGAARGDWDEFERLLAEALETMGEEFLVIDFHGTGRYVQFANVPGTGLCVETVSDRYLKGDRLGGESVAALVALGWSAPGKRPNFFCDFPAPVAWQKAAHLAARTLVEVHGASEPSALEYNAFHKDGRPVVLAVFYGSRAAPNLRHDMDSYQWDTAILKCDCGWTGSKEEASTEYFDELTEVNCPKCEGRIGLVSHPTFDEVERAAARGDHRAQRDLREVREAQAEGDERRRSQLCDPDELADLPGDRLDFVWGIDHERYVIRCGDTVVWSEIAGWEDYERFDEVKAILKEKYGKRFGSLTLTDGARFNLSGDRWSCEFDPE